jgi:hypothetical protein
MPGDGQCKATSATLRTREAARPSSAANSRSDNDELLAFIERTTSASGVGFFVQDEAVLDTVAAVLR